MVFLTVAFFLICVAATSLITILLHDGRIFENVSAYLTTVEKYGLNSQEEYDFRARSSGTMNDIYQLIKTAMNDKAHQNMEQMLAKVVKNKRTPRPGHGKKK